MAQTAPTDIVAQREEAVRDLDLEALRPTIERVCRLARAAVGCPFAYVVLVGDGYAWHSAFEGLDEAVSAPTHSTTARDIGKTETLWVEDCVAATPDHPWVAGAPNLAFYARAPLMLTDGLPIGGLCVGGREPRPVDQAALAQLADLAALLSESVERLRAEAARRESDRESRTANALKERIMHAAPVALAMCDRDFRYIYVNPRWEEDCGVKAERAIGSTVAELFPESFAQLESVYSRCLEGETVWADKVKVPIPGRPDRWLRAEVGPWRDADGEVGGLIAMSLDISELVASLERAERSEARLKLALEIADVIVYEVDYEAKALSTDGAADSFFGGQVPYEMLARDVWGTVHPDDRPGAIAAWEKHLKDGTPFRTEYRMLTADGQDKWAFSGAELMVGEDGRLKRLLGVLKNITDRKKIEFEAERARDEAEAASRAKSEFLANMSHEIRTPLNGVMGVVAALARTELTPVQAEMVDLVRTSGLTLEAILSDLLDLARIESGRLELKREPFHLAAGLRAVADLFRPIAAEKGIGFTAEIDPFLEAWVQGDGVRLRQVVGNLLSNAVKFTSQGEVALTATLANEALVVEVRDTGIGFDAETKQRLFRRFEQADGSITRRFGGTGLGLAISRQLVEAMQGDLDAESAPGEGSTFRLVMPLRWGQAPGAERQAETELVLEGRPPRVLLAEDHAVNRRVVALLLEPLGVELTMTENGAEAVEAAAAGDFDLILMDMQMPVMDGLTAIRTIRAAESARGRRRTPIWGLSANALPVHGRASAEAGADGHLTKPINAERLFEALADAVAASQDNEATALAS